MNLFGDLSNSNGLPEKRESLGYEIIKVHARFLYRGRATPFLC
nr:MAG TPA: hypothetical protein [Bacteriophage sp.]